MSKVKLLVTTGCSFTQYPNTDITWSYHLSQYLQCETLFLGQGAAGNGIISKHTIYQVSEALKKYEPEEILVGTMWSGPDRAENFFAKGCPLKFNHINNGSDNFGNPIKIARDKNFYLMNAGFDPLDEFSSTYYNSFYDRIGAYIRTIENILRTQWFLKLNKIPYFMTTFQNAVLPYVNHKELTTELKHPDVKYLFDMIDFNNFLKITPDRADHNNCYDWCDKYSGKQFRDKENDDHPSTEQHLEFTNRIIIPYLKEKAMI